MGTYLPENSPTPNGSIEEYFTEFALPNDYSLALVTVVLDNVVYQVSYMQYKETTLNLEKKRKKES